MFLKIREHNNKSYVSIVESVWESGKTRHKNIASLGAMSPEFLEQLGRKFLRAAGAEALGGGQLMEIKRVNWGAILVYRYLWNLFELDEILRSCLHSSKARFDVCSAVFNIVVDRLIEPSSKLRSFQRQDYYLGIEPVDLQHYYRCLDCLSDYKDQIERKIFLRNVHLFNMSVDVVFYDVTTLYFESVRNDSLKDFGFSKDHKFGEVQVVVGLLIDQEGRPVGFDVYPGKTFEGNTLITALQKLKNKFDIRQVIIVADRGINSKLNLKAIRDAGYHYIVGSRLRSQPDKIQKLALDLSSYENRAFDDEGQVIFKAKEVQHRNRVEIPKTETEPKRILELAEKLVLCWSLERAKKDRRDRERLVAKATELIDTPSKITVKRGAKRYLNYDNPTHVNIDEHRILADEMWDGIYGIQCSDLTMTGEDIEHAYKKLWRVEQSYRVLKSNIQMRPIFHWTPNRIRGHLVTCFLAFLLTRTLELILQKQRLEFSIEKISQAIGNLEASLVEDNTKQFYLRSNITGLAKDILKALKLRAPKHVFSELPN